MINAEKLVISLLLTWMLFMSGGDCSSITFVAAPEPTPIRPAVAAPTTATALPPAAAPTAAEDPTAAASPANGVDYSNDTENSLDAQTNSDGEQSPSEIQKAVCTVTAGEVRASAEAVTTKTLKGVCGSAELKLAFSDLEAKMYRELQEIKMLLQHLAQKTGLTMPNMPQSMQSVQQPESTTTPGIVFPDSVTLATPKSQPTFGSPSRPVAEAPPNVADNEVPPTEQKRPKTPQLKSFGRAAANHSKPAAALREQEVSKFNNTMLTDRDFKVFTYYWKLENFTAHIESGRSETVESPIFSIKGKSLHIQAHFRHLRRDFFYLQLEYATLKSSNRNNIILDMGGLFKEIAHEQVSFKHKISILNQQQQRSKDLVSQEFSNLEMGFLIPNSALLGSPYIKNDSLLIQIFLYL